MIHWETIIIIILSPNNNKYLILSLYINRLMSKSNKKNVSLFTVFFKNLLILLIDKSIKIVG